MMLKVLILIALLQPCRLPALFIEGNTHTGMHFTGEVLEGDASRIRISDTSDPAVPVIGIPLTNLDKVRLISNGEDDGILSELERHKELLSFLDHESIGRILSAVHGFAETDDWTQFYQWTALLLATDPQWEISRLMHLWKAWALYELKLFEESRKVLDTLVHEYDPLETPVLLCWLMAKLEKRDNAHSRALYWSLLPSLQIPASADPMADDLALLADKLLQQESSDYPEYHRP